VNKNINDENVKSQKYTLFEKIKLWWNRPNFNSKEYWEYSCTAELHYYKNFYTKYSSIKNVAIYTNHFLKKSKTSNNEPLDYSSFVKHNKVVFL